MSARSSAVSPQSSRHAQSFGKKLKGEWLLKYSTLFVLFLLFAGFSLTVDRFLTANNLLNIIQQISMLTIVGAGLTFGFAAREMDLSVGYMVGMSGILVPLMLVAGFPLPVALLAGLGAGLVVGSVNAVLVTFVGVPSLIATLAVGSILYGINFLMTGGRAIYGGLPANYLCLGQGQLFGIPVLAYATDRVRPLHLCSGWKSESSGAFRRQWSLLSRRRSGGLLNFCSRRRCTSCCTFRIWSAKCWRTLSAGWACNSVYRHDHVPSGYCNNCRDIFRRSLHRRHQ